MHIQIPYRPLQITLLKVGGTRLLDINIDGKIQTVLTREVQRDILKNTILHVDFFAVDESATIQVEVPVHFVNESPAVLAKKGILVTGAATIRIETLPSKLISQLEADISGLNEIGDTIHVRDLIVPEGITLISDPDELVARISQTSAARAEEAEVAEGAEETVAEVEIIKKGKTEEEVPE
jgi:large subunit ribosomal protein L25